MGNWCSLPNMRERRRRAIAVPGFVPECVARVPVSLGGLGGEAVFAKSCVCVHNRPQPFATVRNCLQLYWQLQRKCLCE